MTSIDVQDDREDAERNGLMVRQLRAGDERAGVLLDRMYRDLAFRFCWGYLENTADTEDAVQEIFCKVLRARQVPDHFRAWFYRLARNHCLDVLRQRRRRGEQAELLTESRLGAVVTGNLTRLVKHEMRVKMLRALHSLPPQQREILALRYAEGLSRAEIAEVLGLTEKLVKSRLFEGIRKLREHESLNE